MKVSVDSFVGMANQPDPAQVGSRWSQNIVFGPDGTWIQTRPGTEHLTRGADATQPQADGTTYQAQAYRLKDDRIEQVVVVVGTCNSSDGVTGASATFPVRFASLSTIGFGSDGDGTTATLHAIADWPSVRSEMRAFYTAAPYLPPERRWWLTAYRRVISGARYCSNQVVGLVDGDVGDLKRSSLPAPYPYVDPSGGSGNTITAWTIVLNAGLGGKVADIDTTNPHGLSVGSSVYISGTSNTAIDGGPHTVIHIDSATNFVFLVPLGTTLASGASGTVDSSDTAGSAIMTAASAASYGSPAVVGDMLPSTTRYYKIAWADESTAVIINGTGAIYSNVNDARGITQQIPMGVFGGLSGVFSATTGTTGTLISFTALNVEPPADYNVTHVYIFGAADRESEAFYYVGKIPVDISQSSNLATGRVLYDTVAADILVERFTHYNDMLAMPTFETACMWGQRIVGATSSDTFFSTAEHGIYFKVTNGSTRVDLVDSAGDPLNGASGRRDVEWPRWVEQSGGNLFVDGTPQAQSILYIDTDSSTKYAAYLDQAFSGVTDTSVAGRVVGTNKLFIGIANAQFQEQVASSFVTNGDDAFGAPIRSVISEQRDDALLVFTEQTTWAIRGAAAQELGSVVNDNSTSMTRVSATYGCCGPLARCQGLDGVFALTNSALVVATSVQVQDLSNPLIRDWIKTRDYQAKRDAVLTFDPTRNLLYCVIGDECLVFDASAGAFTVWSGGRWRYSCVCDGREDGLEGTGAGIKVLLQDEVGDVTLLNEGMLCDKGLPGTVHFVTATTVNVGATVINVASVPNTYIRGVYAKIVVGTNAGSSALIASVAAGSGGTQDITVGAWSAGNPSAGDVIALGPVLMQYQTGALRPQQAQSHRIASCRVVLDESLSGASLTNARVWLRTYTGGESAVVAQYESPSASADKTVGQCRTSKQLPLPMSATSRRVVVGIDAIQPPVSVLRINELEITTNEQL